jgi:hypothetical protein
VPKTKPEFERLKGVMWSFRIILFILKLQKRTASTNLLRLARHFQNPSPRKIGRFNFARSE